MLNCDGTQVSKNGDAWWSGKDVDAQTLNLDAFQVASSVLEGRHHVRLAMSAREQIQDAPDGDRSGGVHDTGLALDAPVDPLCPISSRPRLSLREAASLHQAGGGWSGP